MPTQLKQVVGSFLTWFAYEKLAYEKLTMSGLVLD
jgi:hypothetical protein